MNLNRMRTRPLDVPRSNRRQGVKALTSMPAGRVVPLAYFPLFREDAAHGRFRFSFEMMETAELLMNAVYVKVHAHLVPWLAFERFAGSMDIFDRSYNGLPPFEGEEVIPFFETDTMGTHGSNEVYKYLGLHGAPTSEVNTMVLEAYNTIWNFRATNRSKDIEHRGRLDDDLAPAFWAHENFAHVVPDFDQAVLDGEVALNVVNARLSLKRDDGPEGQMEILRRSNAAAWGIRTAGANSLQSEGDMRNGATGLLQRQNNPVSLDPNGGLYGDLQDVYAELAENGITVSLSNIELARKTQAFARMREQFVGLHDDHLIDMLMSGLTIPDQHLKQPMLLGQTTSVFGMNKRYSTDADALTASAVNGMTTAELAVHVPRLSTGGIIMLTAEVTPEQLFERRKDPFFHLGSVAELPDYLRDELDPEKVDVVLKGDVDTDHEDAEETFGYEPLNAKWHRIDYRIGGKFYRPEVDAPVDEDRMRLWAVETANPTLSTDFYLCTTMHQKPFLDTTADPFEAVTVGELNISGLTVFGGVLVEEMANYDAVAAKAPTERIEKESEE